VKRGFDILFFILLFSAALSAQSEKRGITPKFNSVPSDLPDSLLYADTAKVSMNPTTAFRLTPYLSDKYVAPMDTQRLNFANSTFIEGRGLSVGYLANIGSPAQSRIFSERDDSRDFIFADGFSYYITTPQNALFYDVKEPYTRLTYLRSGGQNNREEMFDGVMTTNFGRNLNVGFEFDYTYVRGQFTSNSNQMLYYRPFVTYNSDRYEANAYFRNHNYLNTENGGLTNDRYLTHPDEFTDNKRPIDPQSYPTRFTDTWNRLKGKQFYLAHRYNLGFYREMTDAEKAAVNKKNEEKAKKEEQKRLEETGEEENAEQAAAKPIQDIFGREAIGDGTSGAAGGEDELIDMVFVPVSSIFHTFDYEGSGRRFLSKYNDMDSNYVKYYDTPIYGSPDSTLDDKTEAWVIKNSVGLSLREGFQDWVKFGLAAFVNFEKRRFTLPGDSVLGTMQFDEFSTYLGAELSKRRGEVLTYDARGTFCLVGSDIGEFNVEGQLQTRFNVLGKDATVKAFGYLRNYTPAFYLRHYHSRYFWWDQSLRNIQKFYAGGELDIQQTLTKLSASIESVQNYVYFGKKGVPEQFEGNIQVISARAKQDFRYKGFGWDNEVAYQLSSDKSVLPLPLLCAYSNIYLDFAYAKVLNIQLGADAHYYTSYFSPYYEPATQQFQLQDEKRTGNYPIISAYANFKLKQARFFISAYNIGSMLITPPEQFAFLHYPLNPWTLKLGISVYFNN